MICTLRAGAALLLVAVAPAFAQAAKYSIKEAKNPPPQELAKPIQQVLGEESVQLLDESGAVLCEVWFRKEIPAQAPPAQSKKGISYRDVPQTTLLGALKVAQQMTDYRKQRIAPGVYTLRLAMQPLDGDHMGTAPHPEFCLLVEASKDKTPKPMEFPEDLHYLSAEASDRNHPVMLLLFPNDKPADKPQLVNKPGGTWVLYLKRDAAVDGKKAVLGIGLTLIGTSPAA